MLRPIIKLGDPRGLILNYSHHLFEHGIVWDKFPYGVYINALYPREGCFFEALDSFFGSIDGNKLKFRYSAPQEEVELYLISRGYKRYVDAPGTPFYTNAFIPKACVESPRPAEWIEQAVRKFPQFDTVFSV